MMTRRARERDTARQERHRRDDGHEIAAARQRERLIELRAHPAPVALREAQELAQEERQPHRCDQHLLATGVAQRNKNCARRSEAHAGDRGGKREGRGQEGAGGQPTITKAAIAAA